MERNFSKVTFIGFLAYESVRQKSGRNQATGVNAREAG
jgi:hypothetical protein